MSDGIKKQHGVVRPVALHGLVPEKERWYPIRMTEGGFLRVSLDTDFLFDDLGSLVATTDESYLVHQGVVYEAWVYNAAIADDETLIMSTPDPCGAEYHFTFIASCGGDATLELIEDPDIDGQTLIDAYNMNRNYPDLADQMLKDPTLAGGTVLTEIFLPGGRGPQAAGGTATSKGQLHWITNPLHGYAVRLTNISGAAQEGSINVSFCIPTS